MITSIVFDVDDNIYDPQQAPIVPPWKMFPTFDMSHMNQAYIRFRHYSDVGFPRNGWWVDNWVFRFGAVKRPFRSLAMWSWWRNR